MRQKGQEWNSHSRLRGICVFYSVPSVLKHFKDLTQRTLREITEGTEKCKERRQKCSADAGYHENYAELHEEYRYTPRRSSFAFRRYRPRAGQGRQFQREIGCRLESRSSNDRSNWRRRQAPCRERKRLREIRSG